MWYQILETTLGAMFRANISGLKLCAFNTTPCTNYSTNITNQIWFKPPNKIRKMIMLNYGKFSYNQDVKLEKKSNNRLICTFSEMAQWMKWALLHKEVNIWLATIVCALSLTFIKCYHTYILISMTFVLLLPRWSKFVFGKIKILTLQYFILWGSLNRTSM